MSRASAADIVGRVSLYSFSLFFLLFCLASLSSFLLLISPYATSALFTIHPFLVGGVFATGFLFLFNITICHRFLVPQRIARSLPLDEARVHVGLTAYNDEDAIGYAVEDFKAVPHAHRLIVVDNNSKDRTAQVAKEAGADCVIVEMRPGYGSCCMRAMAEAAKDADVIVLCEGDMTFAGRDVTKLLSYLENCDLVLGTRATQELRERGTQMDWLINPANQFVAKLIQIRFWGTRLTDVGCTYRAIRADSYRKLAADLWVTGNHFSPHMTIQALKRGLSVIEIPVYFRKRFGTSKGVGSNKLKAARVALAMLRLLYSA
jgi:glycosyltransferase involved in cell wall biosynthesis